MTIMKTTFSIVEIPLILSASISFFYILFVLSFLQRTVLDWFDMKCSTEDKEGRVFTAVPDDQFVCKTSPSLQQLAVPIAIPLTFFVLLLALCVVAFLMRRRLKVLLYIHTGLHPFDRDPPGDLTAFDVTVCCDVAARDWVLKNIVQPLEGGKYKTFFYNRDAFLGLATQENVRYCVENSRRLVVVLGSRWDGNDLLVNATREALSKCRKDMVHFMTVVVHQFSAKEIDNKDIKQYISKHRYINTEDKHFFKKLLYEMPAVRTSECQRKKNSEKQLVKVSNGQKAVILNDIELTTEYGPNHKKCKGLGYSGDVRRHNGVSVCIGNGSVQATGKEDRQQGTHRRERATKTQGSDGEGGTGPRQYAELGAESEEETAGTDARNRNEPQNQVRAALGMNGNVKPKAQLVFVWYADADLPFTLKAIVEPLESLGHKCVLQDRDFSVGAPIQENIVLAAETCMRSVFVLSNETARNEWFTFAFHVTFDRHLQSKDHRMVLVMREDVDIARFVQEIQQVISTSAVLSDDDPWFERRLIEFMTRHDEVPERQQV
ncbi:MAG: toll/interleukin-1 receptor domain-containing protein [Sulfurovum sp.]|nr:toll/interleukin-1 receptor domain-containing protein [Sulfurovum sp.]